MGGLYILGGSSLEKCGKFRKNGRFSGRIWPDWGNTARADMAGLGSIGLKVFDRLGMSFIELIWLLGKLRLLWQFRGLRIKLHTK